MAELAVGRWNLIKSENFDDYMIAVGVGLMTRKLAGTMKPTQEISVDGDQWEIKTISALKTTIIQFKLNEPFDETTIDGRTVKTTFRLEGNKLIQEQKGDPDSTITREFGETTMVMTLVAKGKTCVRTYQKA